VLEAPDEQGGAAGGEALVLDGTAHGEHGVAGEHLGGELGVSVAQATEDGGRRGALPPAHLGDRRRQRSPALLGAEHALDGAHVVEAVAAVPRRLALRGGEPEAGLPGSQAGHGDAGAAGHVADGQARVGHRMIFTVCLPYLNKL
jgi:hypothetical protein